MNVQPTLFVLVLLLSLSITGGFLIFQDDVERDISVSECQEAGGEVEISNVIGSHGGAHCTFQNGTTVHAYVADRKT